MYDAIDDPYTYDGSTVLINKLDLRDQKELDAFELEISTQRSEEELPNGQLDFDHFRAVHHHLFQDVYDWAGMPRTVRISKQGNAFCYPEHIKAQASKLFSNLKTADFYRNLSAMDFAKGSARFLADLNAIHAFREGNGRAQLSFFAMLAHRAGHPLDMDKFDPDAVLSAMIESFGGNEAKLAVEIERLIAPGDSRRE